MFLLGRFAVEVAGVLVPDSAWRKRRPIEVLSTIALAPGRSLHREELSDRVWPDKDLEAGVNNLHRALHDLRRAAGVDLVAFDRGVARLAEGVWVDVEAFERDAAGASREALASAVALYKGPLLPDDPYCDALAARREGLRQRFVDAGLRLAGLLHAARDAPSVEACVEVLRKVLAQDAALEPAHQLAMRALAESGRKSDALRQFADCVSALRERMDAEPSRETFALRAAIERGDVGPRATASANTPPRVAGDDVAARLLGVDPARAMFGRDDERAAVGQCVAAGRGVLLVIGEAGLGKTRLAAECAATAARAGAAVLVGVALDQDAGVPYAPFAAAWAQHRRVTERGGEGDPFLSFAPSGGSAQDDRLRLFQSVERSLEALAAGNTVCLVIEDLHAADQSSLHLFHHLARATRTLPLLLVGTLREEEIRVGHSLHTLLGSLGRERLGTRVVLARLEREATGRLVAQSLGAAAEPDVIAAVHALAEGNPFHVEEVVQAMREEGAARPSLPANLLDTVRLRVRRLGRDAEKLLAAAALVGQRFAFELARRTAGLEPEAALCALELGVEARVVEEDAGEYRFRHALTREALLGALTHARRVHLHAAAADALEALAGARRDERAEVLAAHLESAGQGERALPYVLTAARRAQARLGFAEAIAFYERALALMEALGQPAGAARFDVLRAMGGMRLALSDLDGAVRDLDLAAAITTDDFAPTPTQRALVERVAALACIQAGRLDEAGVRLERALAALAGSANDPELPAVLYLFAQLRWHEERGAEAKALAERSLAEARARNDRRAMARGHEMLALACHSLGAWQEGHAHERERQALVEGALDVDQAFDVHLCLWEYHLYEDQGPGGIRDAVDQTLLQAERMQAPRAVALCENFGGTLDFQGGRWDAAEAQLASAVERFRRVGSASGEALSLQRLALLLTARGELARARELLDEGIVVGGRAAMRSHCLTRLHTTYARNRLAAGDVPGAQSSLAEGLSEAARHGNCATCSALLFPEAVRVQLAAGDVRGAEGFAERLEETAARFGSRVWTAMARQARARVLAAGGRADEAVAAYDEARGAFDAVGIAYEGACCALAQSGLLEARGESARASELAQSAKRALRALGASELEA